MPKRFAACDPCRLSKLSCDHSRPECSRCRDLSQPETCHYRDRPFKKRMKSQTQATQSLNSAPVDVAFSRSRTATRRYPNPGYLGPSSHSTIYDHLPLTQDRDIDASPSTLQEHPRKQFETSFEDAEISYGAQLIDLLRTSSLMPYCKTLVEEWLSTGVNLALAGTFSKQCAETAELLLDPKLEGSGRTALEISEKLFVNSCRQLQTDVGTVPEFSEQFSFQNARWETLGLFFTAVSRATVDVPRFSPLYETKEERRSIQRLAGRFSDRCLNIAVDLDCLNDLQLMLQYENFIMHSLVNGDQSES